MLRLNGFVHIFRRSTGCAGLAILMVLLLHFVGNMLPTNWSSASSWA